MQTEQCDILICGAGLAGLSLLYRAMKMGVWKNENIIVVDASDKLENDRTWSFWKKGPTDFDHLIHKEWGELLFFTYEGEQIRLDSDGYTYNSIRGLDFYTHVLSWLSQFKNIRFIKDTILNVSKGEKGGRLTTATHIYHSTYLFNSLFRKPELRNQEQYFLQHFKGIRIKINGMAPEKISAAHLMDFRTGQEHGTTFFYTLPLSADEIFVEYTLFSKSLLPDEVYDDRIQEYLRKVLQVHDYEILESECGAIPMTDYRFRRFDGPLIHIGTIGGDTRASTGYTFTNTQKTVSKILDTWQHHGHPYFDKETIGLKQHLYDATLLNVLAEEKYKGYQLFGDLFKHTPASVIFAFLDAETSILQDVKVMKSLRILPFLKAFIAAVFRNLKR